MAWSAQKLNWTTNDAIATTDLNRVEENIGTRYNYIEGLELSIPDQSGTIVNGRFYIKPGMCFYNTGTITTGLCITNTAWMYKNYTTTWVNGMGNGGLYPGETFTNLTWYHVYIMTKADGITHDAFVSSNYFTSHVVSHATLTGAGYSRQRRIGSFLAVSNVLIAPFYQIGGYVRMLQRAASVSASGSTWASYTLPGSDGAWLLPLNVMYLATFDFYSTYSMYVADSNGATIFDQIGKQYIVGSANEASSIELLVKSASIRASVNDEQSATVTVWCSKYFDFRGQHNSL